MNSTPKTEWLFDPGFTEWWNNGGSVEFSRNKGTYGEMAALHCVFKAGQAAFDECRKKYSEEMRRAYQEGK